MDKEFIRDTFDLMLETMDIKLTKTDKGYRLFDKQRGIDYDKYDTDYHYTDTYSVIERLDDMIFDYFVDELEVEPHFNIEEYSNYEDLLNQIGDKYLDNQINGMYDLNIFVLKLIVYAPNIKLEELFKGEN